MALAEGVASLRFRRPFFSDFAMPHTTELETYLASPQLKPREGDLFNVDAALTEEERAVRDSVRVFVDEKVLPIIGQCYVDGRFPKELIGIGVSIVAG